MKTASPKTAFTISPFRFESYGVKIVVDGNHQGLIDDAEARARQALLGSVRKIRTRSFDHEFQVLRKRGTGYKLIHNEHDFGWSWSKKNFLNFFDAILRVSVGELAVDRVFLHSGAVGWKGKAIL